MRLSERVHLVASGWLGYSLSDRHDCHVYLVAGGSASFLVDAGCGLDAAGIAARISGLDVPAVTHILVTHGHADHAAGAGELARLLGGARVCASPEVARMLADADETATGLATARAAGVYPPHLKLAPIVVGRQLRDETWRIGDVTVRSLPTPGHAAGHLCFIADFDGGARAAFTGDLVFARGRVAVLGTPDTDLMALKESIASVAAAAPTALFPGHGSVALTQAGEHLAVALDAFDRGALPPPLLP
jgi:hydroxyacylglutathione hydrolase